MKKVTESTKVVVVQRERRYYSIEARKAVVQEIEKGLSKAEASRRYEVSERAIYQWISKYSSTYEPCLVKVVEHASQSNKVNVLQAELEKTYELLGRAQAEITFLNQILEMAQSETKIDFKKNYATQRSSDSITAKSKSK